MFNQKKVIIVYFHGIGDASDTSESDESCFTKG